MKKKKVLLNIVFTRFQCCSDENQFQFQIYCESDTTPLRFSQTFSLKVCMFLLAFKKHNKNTNTLTILFNC